MTKDEVLKLAKQFIGDTENRLFTDNELSAMLDRVVTQYSYLSQLKTNYADFHRAIDGEYHYPADFQSYKVGFNDYRAIEIAQAEDFIEDYKVGKPEYIYDDNTDTDIYNLYPIPNEDDESTYLWAEDYGIIKDGNQYGLLPYGGYGCINEMQLYKFYGGYYYVCKCEVEDIKDIMALIFGMMAESLLADTEMRNHEVALIYKRIFETRCYSAKNRIAIKNRGKKLSGVYY